MKLRPEAGIALAVVSLAAVWPFWHEATRGRAPLPAPEGGPEIVSAPDADISSAGSETGTTAPVCSACSDLTRLARRLKAREEGAARRFESASNSLSVVPVKSALDPASRRQLELALRRAQDDKRGAGALRAATLEALVACESGSGCGETPLAEFWDEACPPEHPDLGREAVRLASVSRVLAARVAACAAAACPEIDCARHARTVRLLSMADRSLSALLESGHAASGAGNETGGGSGQSDAVRELVDAAGVWRDRVAALFLGGPDPAAQIRAAAAEAASLAQRLTAARPTGGASRDARFQDPYWRIRVLSIQLDRVAEDLNALARAVESGEQDRDAVLFRIRRQLAGSFRELLITQMRMEAARELATAVADEDAKQRCDARRAEEIARMRGQIRVQRAALKRCALRATCPVKAGRQRKLSTLGLDPVSEQRLSLDLALDGLGQEARLLSVRAQGPVEIDTVRPRFQSGEAVSVRIDQRSTACMADSGAWVGLFPADAPPLRGGEAADAVIRRLNLRGRPWEEVWFEAPQRPGSYEVRTYASQLRSGAITGRASFQVEPRERGCSGFTGTWKTNFGRLQITVRDGEVRGSYKRPGAYRAGFLTGKVKGRVLMGQWQSELGGGGTRLVLREDGKSFSGTWSHFRDEFAGTGIWKGSCDGPVRPQSGSDRERNEDRE